MNVLVAGGAGYIGSHTVKRLKEAGHSPVIYDNLSRGHRTVVDILKVPAVAADLNDRETLVRTLREHKVDTVMHFAAYAYVGESVEKPLMYYQNNVATTVSVLEAMKEAGVNRFVFSSTCAVYGTPDELPVTEDTPVHPESPYGESKLAVERMLAWYDTCHGMSSARLRYFNAAGAALDASIGEDWTHTLNLIPLVMKAALGKVPRVQVFGTDYPTPDGTAIRDYIHVEDLGRAHLLALQAAEEGEHRVYNLGNGAGFSVKEVIEAARRVTGRHVEAVESPRRSGDPAVLVASSDKIRAELGWKPEKSGLEAMVSDAWEWMQAHPNGYE